jgi:hypothetical protein
VLRRRMDDAGWPPSAEQVALVESLHEAISTGDADALEEGCKAICKLTADGYDDIHRLIEAGAFTALVEAIREATRVGHADVLEHACRALSSLRGAEEIDFVFGQGEGTRRVIQAGAHVALVNAIRETIRTAHACALEQACGALRSLAAGEVVIKAALVQAGAYGALVETIHAATSAGNEWAPVHACRAIRALADGDDESQAGLLDAGAHVAIVEAIVEATRAGKARASELSCCALCDLAAVGDEIKTGLVVAGAHAALVEVMRHATRTGHLGGVGVSCSALAMLIDGDHEIRSGLVQAGAHVALVAAIHAVFALVAANNREEGEGDIPDTIEDDLKSALAALDQLAAGGDEIKAALLQAGAHMALVEAFRWECFWNHPDEDGVIHDSVLMAACRSLWDLAAGGDEIKAALVQAGVHKALADVTYKSTWCAEEYTLMNDETVEAILGAIESLATGSAETKAALVRDGFHERLRIIAVGWPSEQQWARQTAWSALVEIAGPGTTRAEGEPEPVESLVNRLRVTRISFELPVWAASAANRVAPVLAAGLPLLFAANVCVFAFGCELLMGVPSLEETWRRQVAQSAESAVGEALRLDEAEVAATGPNSMGASALSWHPASRLRDSRSR